MQIMRLFKVLLAGKLDITTKYSSGKIASVTPIAATSGDVIAWSTTVILAAPVASSDYVTEISAASN